MGTDIKANSAYTNRNAWLTEMYKDTFPLVARYIARMGGSLDEARDVFQDALIIYYEKLLQNQLELRHSEKSYLFGIARHLWTKRYRESTYQESFKKPGDNYDEMAIPDTADLQISSSRLFHLLQTAGQKCMELLSAFYYEDMNMEKLAEKFGFSGRRSATVQKFKCLKKIKETIKEKSLQYEDIYE